MNENILSGTVLSSGEPAPAEGPQGRPKINTLAVAAAVCAALGFITAVGFPAAVVTGHMALSRIKHGGGRESGRGLALAAVIVGWIPVIAVTLLLGVLFTVGLVTAAG